MPNPFIKLSDLFQTIQLSMSAVFQKHFYFKLFSLIKKIIIQTIPFSISTQFKYPEHLLEGLLPLCRGAVGIFYSNPWTVFLIKDHSSKPMVSQFVKIIFFKTKTCFSVHGIFLCKFHMVCTSQLLKIWWQASVQTSSNDLLPFWKKISKNFCYKPITNNAELTFIEKNSDKKFSLLF